MKTAITMISVSKYFEEGKMDVEGFIKFCDEIKVEGVDLLEYYWKDKEAEIKKVSEWLKESGIVLSCFGIGNNFAVSTEEEMQKQVDYVKEGVDVAIRLGADKVRIFGGHIGERMSRTEGLSKVKEGIGKCLPYAEGNKIIFVLENHGDLPGLSGEIKEIIEEFNSPCLRCNLDIANFMAHNVAKTEDPVSATKNLINYVSHTHIKDMKYDKESRPKACISGEGFIPIKECLQILKDHDYQGYLSLEFEDETVDELEGIRKSIDFIKMSLASLK